MNIKIFKTLAAFSLCAILLCSCSNKSAKSSNVTQNNIDVAQNNNEAYVKFENQSFAKAFGEALKKSAYTITENDCLSVKYIAVGKDDVKNFSLYIGFDDYSTAYFNELEKGENADPTSLLDYISSAPLQYSDKDIFDNDLKLFKNVEIFELYDIKLYDISFLKDMPELYYGYFMNNGITDISALSDFNPEFLRELDFTGNNISDWEPLMHISDKIIVNYSTQEFTSEDGQSYSIPFTTYLSDLNKSIVEQDENSDTPEAYFDESINWGSLFDDE